MIRRGKTAETLTFTMPDTAEDAALLQALNTAIDDISPDLKVTGIVDFDKEARIRRVNLLEILAEENENVHPPPDDGVGLGAQPAPADVATQMVGRQENLDTRPPVAGGFPCPFPFPILRISFSFLVQLDWRSKQSRTPRLARVFFQSTG